MWIDSDIYAPTIQEAINSANSRFPNIKYRAVPTRKTQTQRG